MRASRSQRPSFDPAQIAVVIATAAVIRAVDFAPDAHIASNRAKVDCVEVVQTEARSTITASVRHAEVELDMVIVVDEALA